ncbi:MAG: hypothetical protein REJ50_00505 [Bordetella sp.]|nr:hypothetical protein [Bordetella sp.]
MALTRDFKETVLARVQADPKFRDALLKEGIETMLAGDVDSGKAILAACTNKGFGKLIAAARERLKRPWESAALDAEAVKQALGDQAAKTHNALLLSDQIGPILASGTKGKPVLRWPGQPYRRD